MIHVVLLSGGSGTRLWPLSNSVRAKQFLKVLRTDSGDPCSMVQRVTSQLGKTNLQFDTTVVTNKSQLFLLDSQLFGEHEIVIEPESRDTGPAIMLACAHLLSKPGNFEDDTVIVLPIDCYADQDFFNCFVDLNAAVQERLANVVLLGVSPTTVSEKFGYIVPKKGQVGDVLQVAYFVEKPDAASAAELIEKGCLWNCGVFAFQLSYAKEIIKAHAKSSNFDEFEEGYRGLSKKSFDYLVLEREPSIAVIPFFGKWKDLGTWDALSEEMAYQSSGHVACSDVSNSIVINETSKPMIVSGVSDLIAVATQDGILVCSKEASSKIKDDVKKVSSIRPMYEKRLWGEYRVIDNQEYPAGQLALTKELVIHPGKQISYQRHAQRSEIWTVVSGSGEVVLDNEVFEARPGKVFDIKPRVLHAVRANDMLHIIEVQFGERLTEDDIERFGSYWS